MKSVHELSAEEFEELRERYIIEFELDHDRISDEEVRQYYSGTSFVEEDFWCNLGKELTPQEQLFEWWQLLPFEAKEKIHDIKLFGLNEEDTQEALDECLEDWFAMEDEQRINHFINFYDKYLDFVGDRFDKLFDELYNS